MICTVIWSGWKVLYLTSIGGEADACMERVRHAQIWDVHYVEI